MNGDEIFFDPEITNSCMSSYFLSKWQQKNEQSEIFISGEVVVAPIKMKGRIYPVALILTPDFSPLTLGQDFFAANNWQITEDHTITTPYGKIQTVENRIDTELTENVFAAEEIMEKKKGTRQEKIRKLHKYFGHTSGDGLWRVIRKSSNPEAYTKTEIEQICKECQICQLSSRNPCKKKTSLPRATAFNQVVTMDLKVCGDGNYILWMCDDATRLIRGQVIKNKEPDTIIEGMDKIWINGYGMGPGIPEKYFMTDNGGEFLNTKLLNLCQEAGIKLKKTSSFSPQQNGLNERNHGVTDLMIEKIRRENPRLTLQEAVNKATFARNSLINAQRGFSPFQLVFGRSPTLQGASDCTTGGLEDLTGGEISRNILWQQETIRQEMNKTDHDWRIKTAMKDRLPTTTNIRFNIGDQVVFRDGKDGKRHDARIVGFEGMNALLKWGNMDRKVPERELLPSYEVHQEVEQDETTTTEPGREKEESGSSISSEKPDTKNEEKRSETSLEDQDDDSDTEIIIETRPKRRGPKRKKLEIIPEITENKVVRQEKRAKPEQEDKNEQPTREVWSEDEDGLHLTKNTHLTRPKRWKHVNMWNLWGEKFSGCVLDVEKGNKKKFRIQEHGTLAVLGIDLDNLNYWEYTNPPETGRQSPKPEGEPSNQAWMTTIKYF